MSKITIRNLSSFNAPCYVIYFKNVTIMIDCAVDYLPLLNFLPFTHTQEKDSLDIAIFFPDGLKMFLKSVMNKSFMHACPLFGVPNKDINFSEIDIILISNYQNILALPYFIKQSKFLGTIYATEPTYQFGRLYLYEVLNYFEQFSSPKLSPHHVQKLVSNLSDIEIPFYIRENLGHYNLTNYSTPEDIEKCLELVKTVSFNESIDIFGILTCLPTSAGYCIGSCNWVIQSDYEKIVYLSKSSTLTAHPKPLDLANIRDPDVVILTELTRTPDLKPDAMITEFSKTVLSTIHAGGNVLIPCPLSGVTFDLLECLHLSLAGGYSGQSVRDPVIYFISPEAKSSLAYANIFSEWLCTSKQVKVYLPEEPFVHAEMLARGTLKQYPDVSGADFNRDFRTPCVVFAGHTSLRFGPAVNFMRLWKSDPKNTIVLIDPYLYHPNAGVGDNIALGIDGIIEETLAPFQPIYARIVKCPIDTGLGASHVRKLLKDVKPKTTVVCPDIYSAVLKDAMASTEHTYQLKTISSPVTRLARKDVGVDYDVQTEETLQRSIVEFVIKSPHDGRESGNAYQRVRLSEEGSTLEMLTQASVIQVSPDTYIGPAFQASLSARDNAYTLKVEEPSSETENKDKLRRDGDYSIKPNTWGDLDESRLVKKLQKSGFNVDKLTQHEAQQKIQADGLFVLTGKSVFKVSGMGASCYLCLSDVKSEEGRGKTPVKNTQVISNSFDSKDENSHKSLKGSVTKILIEELNRTSS